MARIPFKNGDKRGRQLWHKKAVMADGSEVVTGSKRHREAQKKRREAGTPPAIKGRPSTYNKFHAVNARKLMALGANDTDVREFFGISRKTLYAWMKDYPEFLDAMRFRDEDGVARDNTVGRNLYNRATGYSFHSEKIFLNEGEVVRVPFVEHVPPDVRAQEYWLRNRQPNEWGDRREIDVNARVAMVTKDTSLPEALQLFRAVLNGATIDLDAVEVEE